MKLYHKLIVLFIPVIIVLCAVTSALDVTVNIKWQWLIIWTPANIELGSFSSSKEVTFSDYIRIEDLRESSTGHYTSIQWVIYWSNWEIVSGTVEFKTNNPNIYLIWGVEDNADFNRNLISFTDITEPKLLFYRNNNQNLPWYFNKYWFKPSVKVTVPSGSNGPYTVRLFYTLYDISTDIITQ